MSYGRSRRICVITGGRADFGLLSPTLKLLDLSDAWELILVGVGMHFAESQGLTSNFIEKDGFYLADKVELKFRSTSPQSIVEDFGTALSAFGQIFEKRHPDALLVLGDRYEVLAAALAAYVQQIPIVHLHGGELTGGLIDEGFRHSITKLASLHLVAAPEYASRVVQMGEQPNRVVVVGATGAETVIRLTESGELSYPPSAVPSDLFLVLTYHPVTLLPDFGIGGLRNILLAIESFPVERLLITAPNVDSGGNEVLDVIRNYLANSPFSVEFREALGHVEYLQTISRCSAVVGNSSSGLLEASVLGVPVLNIGPRQSGRIMPRNVVTVNDDLDSIKRGLDEVLTREHRATAGLREHPFGDGKTSINVITAIDNFFTGQHPATKTFYDLPDRGLS